MLDAVRVRRPRLPHWPRDACVRGRRRRRGALRVRLATAAATVAPATHRSAGRVQQLRDRTPAAAGDPILRSDARLDVLLLGRPIGAARRAGHCGRLRGRAEFSAGASPPRALWQRAAAATTTTATTTRRSAAARCESGGGGGHERRTRRRTEPAAALLVRDGRVAVCCCRHHRSKLRAAHALGSFPLSSHCLLFQPIRQRLHANTGIPSP